MVSGLFDGTGFMAQQSALTEPVCAATCCTDCSCLLQLASDYMNEQVRGCVERRGDAYTGLDMEQLFPGCWTPVEEELGMVGEGTYATVY